jgi:integrase
MVKRSLSAAAVNAIARPGFHAVGDGVYLQIGKNDSGRSWVFRYQLNGRAHLMGLGSARYVTLAEARAKGREQRRLLIDKIDPLTERRARHRQRLLDIAHAKTFKDCATAYIASHEAGWRGWRSHAQWTQSLRDHVYPHFGDVSVSAIDTTLVLAALEPIWRTKPETASRVRQRIEAVLDWAKARGYRNGQENPARWKGHLDNLLPARSKVKRVQHFAALPYAEVPALMQRLLAERSISAAALRFLILTASRTGEVLGARWSEISGGTWTIPGERMKSGRPHRVPLAPAARELLAALPREAEFVFVGARTGAAANRDTLNRLLGRMGHDDITVHGFRSAFRDWAAETTHFPNHVIEMALAHAISSSVEAAYRRGDLFEKRRELMATWADYCAERRMSP